MNILSRLFLISFVLLIVSIDLSPGHGRARKHYRNTLMRMHHHSWSVSELIEGLLTLLQNWLMPDNSASKAESRKFFFLFDNQNNGSSNFVGLNVSQRNVAYDAMVKAFEWIGFIITEHFFVTYVDTRGQ